jgi:hypothetical protein
MIRRIGIGLVAVAVLAMPAVASAEVQPSEFKNAAKYCKALKKEIGDSAFATRFGTNHNKRNAFGKCVSQQRKSENGVVSIARAQCKAEYAQDPAAFLVKYGQPTGNPNNNGNSNNGNSNSDVRKALRNCLRDKLPAVTAQQIDVLHNAAQECRQERAQNADDFRNTYGSNHNKRNAFGKCVVKKVREAQQS